MNGGAERENGGHVLKDTTSRGQCVRVWPPRTIERRGGGCEHGGWRGEEVKVRIKLNWWGKKLKSEADGSSHSSDKYFKHAVALSSLDYDRLFKCNFPNLMTIDLENLGKDTPSVEKWLNVGDAEPTTGRNLQNPSLAEALQHKIEFTRSGPVYGSEHYTSTLRLA